MMLGYWNITDDAHQLYEVYIVFPKLTGTRDATVSNWLRKRSLWQMTGKNEIYIWYDSYSQVTSLFSEKNYSLYAIAQFDQISKKLSEGLPCTFQSLNRSIRGTCRVMLLCKTILVKRGVFFNTSNVVFKQPRHPMANVSSQLLNIGPHSNQIFFLWFIT